MTADPEIDALRDRIDELEAENERLRASHKTRRRLLRGGLAVGALSLFAGVSTANTPEGTVSGTSTDSLLAIEADRVNFESRTSDLSNPDDGTLTYRSDL